MPRDLIEFPEITVPVDVGADRLRILADFLPTVPPEHFAMESWWCDTSACAAGWATTIPELKAAGLRREGSEPAFREQTAFFALAAFFDLPSADFAIDFFSPHRVHEKPRDVAARIHAYLIERQKAA